MALLRIVIEDNAALNVYDGARLLVGFPASSMYSILMRAEAPLRDVLDGKRISDQQARRIMRLYYAGMPGEYEIE